MSVSILFLGHSSCAEMRSCWHTPKHSPVSDLKQLTRTLIIDITLGVLLSTRKIPGDSS
jgi:hypothetical protein